MLQVAVNDKPVSPAYQNGEFRVTTTGIDTVLVIPQIQAKITFSGLIFSIYLPYSEFAGNTEGQCGEFWCQIVRFTMMKAKGWFLMNSVSPGTCDNNRKDDCMLPSGRIDPSCPNMAHEWHADDSYCEHPIQPSPTRMPNTCNTTICEVIKGR